MPVSAPGDHDTSRNQATLAALRQRRDRLRLWFYLFVALMPLGCIGPFGLFLVVPKGTPQTVLVITGLVLPLIGLAGALLMMGDRGKTRRALALAEQAEQMGLQFTEKPAREDYAWAQALKMYSNADAPSQASNMLTGEVGGFDVAIMDYVFIVGLGQNKNVYEQTLFALHGGARGLPDFLTCPRTWVDTLSRLVCDHPVELPDQQAFGKQFTIRGNDPEAIRPCFSTAAVELCSRYPDQTIEVQNGLLAMHRFKKRADPTDYPEILAHMGRMAKAFQAEPGAR